MKMRRKPGGEKRPDDFATALRLGRPRLMGSGRLPATLHRRYLVLENELPLKHSCVMKDRHDRRGAIASTASVVVRPSFMTLRDVPLGSKQRHFMRSEAECCNRAISLIDLARGRGVEL